MNGLILTTIIMPRLLQNERENMRHSPKRLTVKVLV